MSHPDPTADRRVAPAVAQHHAEVGATLDPHTGRSPAATDGDRSPAGGHEPIGAERETGCCGGACGCGGDAATARGEAAVLSIDPRLDVRDVPHAQRHARVLAALDALPADGALVLVAPHAPRPLLAEVDRRYGAGMTAQWLQDGPDVWQIRLQRVPARL